MITESSEILGAERRTRSVVTTSANRPAETASGSRNGVGEAEADGVDMAVADDPGPLGSVADGADSGGAAWHATNTTDTTPISAWRLECMGAS
jgi:hypothetical protein